MPSTMLEDVRCGAVVSACGRLPGEIVGPARLAVPAPRPSPSACIARPVGGAVTARYRPGLGGARQRAVGGARSPDPSATPSARPVRSLPSGRFRSSRSDWSARSHSSAAPSPPSWRISRSTIEGELAPAGLGEIDAVAGAQLAASGRRHRGRARRTCRSRRRSRPRCR